MCVLEQNADILNNRDGMRFCVRTFVGSCLATKNFYRQFAGYRKGLGHHKVGQ